MINYVYAFKTYWDAVTYFAEFNPSHPKAEVDRGLAEGWIHLNVECR
jgi:hypothetical protein